MSTRAAFTRSIAVASTLAFLALSLPRVSSAAAVLPELPRVQVDTTMPVVTGQSVTAPSGGNLQTAINNAQPGDEIVLQAGATYGAITLPVKSGNAWIIIRSSRANELPVGTRVSPADAPKMARILGGAGASAAVQTANGAHHYRFVGIEFTVTSGAFSTGLVRFGTGSESSLSQMPHHLVLDRCYVHGDPSVGGRRGVALNSGEAAVIDSHISGWRGPGQDTQAIGGWNGPGPYKIENNYLEGASENIMFGGADPLVNGMLPSDITIRRNHLFKPTSWRNGGWQVKNLFELKNAQRVLIDGNLFENNWAEAQNGTAILFSVRNQEGTAPWTSLNDITFTNNIVRHVAAGLKITGFDDTGYTVQQTRRVLVRNNVFDDVNSGTWGGDGRMFFLLYGATDVTLDHNTGFPDGAFIIADNSRPFPNHVITNNVSTHGAYGVKGDGNGDGIGTLTNLFPGYVFSRNAVIGGSSSAYPADNFVPSGTSGMGFVDFGGGNYRLSATSVYKTAGTDGTAIGADLDALEAAMAGASSSTGGGSASSVTASFSNPPANATVSGTVTVTVAATGGTGTGYTYAVRAGAGALIYSGTNPSFGWPTTTSANGIISLTATVTDSGGATASVSRTVTVANQSGTTAAQLQSAKQYATATWPNYKSWEDLPQYLKDSALLAPPSAGGAASAISSSSSAPSSAAAKQYATATWPNYKSWEDLPQYLKDAAVQGAGSTGGSSSSSSSSSSATSSAPSSAAARQYALTTWPNYKSWEDLPQYLKDASLQAAGGTGGGSSSSSSSSSGPASSAAVTQYAMQYAAQTWPNYRSWDTLPQYLKSDALQTAASALK